MCITKYHAKYTSFAVRLVFFITVLHAGKVDATTVFTRKIRSCETQAVIKRTLKRDRVS